MPEIKKRDIGIYFGFSTCKIYDVMKYNQITTSILFLNFISVVLLLGIIYNFKQLKSQEFMF